MNNRQDQLFSEMKGGIYNYPSIINNTEKIGICSDVIIKEIKDSIVMLEKVFAVIITVITVLGSLIFNMVLMIYFSRAKVREQFA